MDGGDSRLSESEDDDDLAVFVDGQWVNVGGDEASPIGTEDVVFSPTPSSPSSSGCSPIDCNNKRKNVVSSTVPSKKRHLDDNKVSSCPVSRRDNDLVENTSSILTEDEVEHLLESANVTSTDYEFSVPSKDQRANKPPEGYISVYEKQIGAGLRFPLHDLVIEICNLMNVSPTQLTANAHRRIVGFILCAKLYKIPAAAKYFFSLFKIYSVPKMDLFYFHPLPGKHFLEGGSLPHGPWKRKFFFLRPRGKSWNCLTKWSKTVSRTKVKAVSAYSAVNLEIMKHHFLVNKLTCKELLIHGGIEPGVPPPESTFRYLMHQAAVTKFELLPEDMPPARGTTSTAKTRAEGPLSAPASSAVSPVYTSTANGTPVTIPSMKKDPTSTAGAASPAQLNSERHVKHQNSLSSAMDTEIPSAAEVPIWEDFPTSYRDSIPLKKLFRKENEDRTSKSFESHVNTKSAAPIADDQAPTQVLPASLIAMSQVLDSMFVPKECFQKLETEREELKFRVQELEQELELCKAKRADSDIRTSSAMELVKILEKTVENLKSESDQLRDNIGKDAIMAFKSCRLLLLNLGKLPKGSDFDFFDVADDATTHASSKKSIKPER